MTSAADIDLLELAERVEKATAGQQRELIADAWDLLGQVVRPTGEDAGRFGLMLDAEAYESAALMLVPEGFYLKLSVRGRSFKSSAAYTHPDLMEWGVWYREEAATPALSIAVAALRAKAAILTKREAALSKLIAPTLSTYEPLPTNIEKRKNP